MLGHPENIDSKNNKIVCVVKLYVQRPLKLYVTRTILTYSRPTRVYEMNPTPSPPPLPQSAILGQLTKGKIISLIYSGSKWGL